MMMSTPEGGCWSYADVATDANVGPASFWLARHFNHPEWLYLDRKMILADDFTQEDQLWRFNPCILIYSVGLDIGGITKPEENIWYNDGNQPLFVYRSDFDCENDVYLGIKGGYPKQGHSHMDGGAFYYVRDGIVWSGDPGSDSYNLPGYNEYGQEGGRWDVFRCSLNGHSTISFDDSRQIVTARSKITDHFYSEEKVGAVVDLSPACAEQVSKAERTIYLEGEVLHIIDHVRPYGTIKAKWNLFSESDGTIVSPNTVILVAGDKKMELKVHSPENVTMYVLSAEGSAGEASNPGCIVAGFTTELAAVQEHELHVTLTPVSE